MKQCPFCAEEIQDAAIVCKHCRRELRPPVVPEPATPVHGGEGGFYCPTCKRQTLHKRETPNHILHFLITFFTCGLWVIVWLLLSFGDRPWRCTSCGTEYRPARGGAGVPAPKPTSPAQLAALALIPALMLLALSVLLGINWFRGREAAVQRQASRERYWREYPEQVEESKRLAEAVDRSAREEQAQLQAGAIAAGALGAVLTAAGFWILIKARTRPGHEKKPTS